MKKALLNLILLGDPASGKATQAARLVARYRLYDFDMGREVKRPAVRSRYDYKGTTARGGLTPTHVVRGILRRVIPSVPPGRGILFDGHPKMIGEAKLVANLLRENGRTGPLVIYLSIPISEALRRAKRRRRDDDAPEALKRRERYYRDQIRRVVAFFRKRYAFRKISGAGTPDAVWKRINKVVHQYASQDA
jgi:adenylate kinase